MKAVEQQLHDYFESLPEAQRAPAPTTAEFLDSTPTEPDMNHSPRTFAVAAVALIAVGITLFALLGGGDDGADLADSVRADTTEVPTTTTEELATTEPEPDADDDELVATLAVAERFVDVLVSFDVEALDLVGPSDPVQRQPTLTWMGFHEVLNLEVLDRSCAATDSRLAVCTVDTRNDLIVIADGPDAVERIEITLWVADGKVTVASSLIESPPVTIDATEWALDRRERPDEGPCAHLGGDMQTPAACAEAMVVWFQEYPGRHGATTGG